MIEIKGKIKKVTYYNSDNGYGVVRVEISPEDAEKIEEGLYSNELTVVSTFAKIPFIDEIFEFSGNMVESKYGLQFKADVVKQSITQSKEGIIAYLSSDLFPGIGEATATRIYDELGSDALKKIANDADILDKIKISRKQKETLYGVLKQFSTEEKMIVDLLSFGLTLKLANKLISVFKSKTVEIVKENPYQLINNVSGIGFLRADEIAYKVGIPRDSDIRLKSLIIFILDSIVYDSGNTYMHLNDLYFECKKFLQNENNNVLNRDNYVRFIKELVDEKRIIVDSEHNVYDVKTYFWESSIARKIYNFLSTDGKDDSLGEDFSIEKVNDIIEEVEISNKIKYNDKQIEAILKAVCESIVIITGGPGTGKSTVIKGIIDTYSRMFGVTNEEAIRDNIMLCAPTGRAAKRLKEVTNHSASTIHKMLGFTGSGFTIERIDAKMIIIDEFSMVDVGLAYQLFKSINPGTKIVIVGDADQLPAVGPGDVLNDLILSKEVTTIRLSKIHRQLDNSSIIDLAHSINEGRIPNDILDCYEDRVFIKSNDEYLASLIVKEVNTYLKKGYNLIEDIQVLIPMYNVSVGINNINAIMQNTFNPIINIDSNEYVLDDSSSDKALLKEVKEVKFGSFKYRINDKVIQLINRADKGIMNGDIGWVKRINVDHNTSKVKGITVKYDVGDVEYDMDELSEIRLAYAISIHKAQGSEFKVAIVPFSYKYYIMLKRKLIYTAITRAKSNLIMCGNFNALCQGVTQVEEKRKTLLKEKLLDLINNNGVSTEYKDTNLSVFEDNFSEDYDEDINPYDFM